MTKKDYIKLADIINRYTVETPSGDYIAKDSFMDELCDTLKRDNPGFNIGKFITACRQ